MITGTLPDFCAIAGAQSVNLKTLDAKKLSAMDAGVISHLSVEQIKSLSKEQVRTRSARRASPNTTVNSRLYILRRATSYGRNLA